MSQTLVEQIADAVLYEGYMLYPYRPSSVKNRQRWTFGGLFPQACALARNGLEPCFLQTECLVERGTAVQLRVRFLHLITRTIAGRVWQEAEDHTVEPEASQLGINGRHEFTFPGRVEETSSRIQLEVRGAVEWWWTEVGKQLSRLCVRVSNQTAPEHEDGSREELLPIALVSTHVILKVEDGAFVSLLEPLPQQSQAVAECKNVGVWPVLVGSDRDRDTMLASPIILYDYPEIAPESPGDLFDGTEIDEILTLRILTMTDDEKREMRATDPRADALLSRTEALSQEELLRMHGVLRTPRSDLGGPQ